MASNKLEYLPWDAHLPLDKVQNYIQHITQIVQVGLAFHEQVKFSLEVQFHKSTPGWQNWKPKEQYSGSTSSSPSPKET